MRHVSYSLAFGHWEDVCLFITWPPVFFLNYRKCQALWQKRTIKRASPPVIYSCCWEVSELWTIKGANTWIENTFIENFGWNDFLHMGFLITGPAQGLVWSHARAWTRRIKVWIYSSNSGSSTWIRWFSVIFQLYDSVFAYFILPRHG